MLLKTPPMGYNTWNTFGTNISDSLIRETADAMVDFGLLDAGYQYLVIDDCWSEKKRDPITDKIVPDKNKFPNGMKSLSDYVHGKGLKFGMYSCAGVRTCGDYPGSFGHEFLDARTFAEYGCDYLKYDYCYKPEDANGELLYRRMGVALENCGRDIVFSACNWGSDNVHQWIRSTGASLYRSTGDVFDNFVSFTTNAMSQLPNFCYSAPGCFNDIDMLTVGMFGQGNVGTEGCNFTDYVSQFSLWCFLGAPLMLGCDVRNMTPEVQKLVTNKELIRIDQDPECRPAYDVLIPECPPNPGRTLFRHLSNNEYALGLFNFDEKQNNIYSSTHRMGFAPDCGLGVVLTDVMTGEEFGPETDYFCFPVEAHGCRIFRARAVKL